MDGACPNPYGCEWGIASSWRGVDWLGRLDIVLLAFLLAYTLAIVVHLSYRYHIVRRGPASSSTNRRKLLAQLNAKVNSLKSIAFISPYLGLVGTCFGIMNAFSGFDMEKSAVLAWMASKMAGALFPAAIGIMVAVPATCSYNYLRTCQDLLQDKVPARRLQLAKRFSELPAFALIAAPGLAILVAGYMTFASFRSPVGFNVKIASGRCESDVADRLIVLRIATGGRLFLNTEQQTWSTLGSRLSEIYSNRVNRTLYLFADDGVQFQPVAEALDIVEQTTAALSSPSPRITVQLITPAMMNSRCTYPVATSARPHATGSLLINLSAH